MIKTIQEQFTRLGFEHRQVWRNGMVAIYARNLPKQPPHFEAVKLRVAKGHPMSEDKDRLIEHYPSAEQWGVYGFTATTLDKALHYAQRINQTQPRGC